MKRFFCFAIVLLITVSVAGCGRPKVDPNLMPGQFFSNYDLLTQLYGTPRMDTPNALGFDLQQVENISDSRWGFPITEQYSELEFDVSVLFKGKENLFAGVYMERTYEYPAESETLIYDAVEVCKQLCNDFGPATDNSYFFNWVEVRLGEQWNKDVKFWQDAWVLKRVVDEKYSGLLLVWDLTPIASAPVQQTLDSLGSNGRGIHALACSMQIDADNGIATLTITY